ncbi:MAG: RNA polymerase sigma factor [Ruminiclostridium sp.]|nr:RNA polymerase sigma factor [Ruminiclostridium sp.]
MSGNELKRYVELYRTSVTNAALFIVKNPADAEDIVQDVFLKLYIHTGEFKNDEHVRAWLLRCAINGSLNLVRSGWHKNSVSLDSIKELPDNNPETGSEIRNAMMSLDPKLRAVLYLHYFEGYTDEETAKMTGISTAAVKGRLRRGRDKLRNLIENERG